MEPQYWSIARLPGMTRPQIALLEQNKIRDTKTLLALTRSAEAKLTLANRLRVNHKNIQKWAALADLARIPSVGDKYCGLILHAGIVSVAQLARTPFHRLHGQIVRLQVATLNRKDLSTPVKQVKRWVEEAKILQQTTPKC
ncbi:MAG: DUF4332 domain-containing protein [Cyanobacteria bacterium P01_G01_bin.19]